jgi:hydroxyethylthiazole kinase-like uncharacterized protein yjeF
MRILDTRQMREADRRTIEDLGVPASTLMENAGLAVVDALTSVYGPVEGKRVAVLSGRGNNGGDGFVIARHLADRGAAVIACLLGSSTDLRGDAREKGQRLREAGVELVELVDADDWLAVRDEVLSSDLVVDAIVGTGFEPPLRGLAAALADALNAARMPVVAVDLPSGLSADRADLPGPVLRASFTVALAALKLPLVQLPAAEYAGRLVVADIGIPRSVLDAIEGPRLEAMTRDDARRVMPVRKSDSHKGQYGHVGVVAGSRGKTGAAVLAGRAALRSGAGLVTVATPASLLSIVAGHGPELMTVELPESADGLAPGAASAVNTLGADVLVVGPGLGRGEAVADLVKNLVAGDTRLVLDADALNALASLGDDWSRARRAEIILTPHPGEMARLIGGTTNDVQARRIEIATDYAARHGVVVVLKGHRTVVAAPSGVVSLNMSGNPGMATAGSGDVLSGAIGAWWGQLDDAWTAATLGVYLHGFAGDLAARDVSQVALTAGDIIDRLGAAVLAIAGRSGGDI